MAPGSGGYRFPDPYVAIRFQELTPSSLKTEQQVLEMSPTHLPHTVRDLLGRVEPPPAKPYVLSVLVLFVIWLLGAGYDLVTATAAAIAVSWAASGPSAGPLPPLTDAVPSHPSLTSSPSAAATPPTAQRPWWQVLTRLVRG